MTKPADPYETYRHPDGANGLQVYMAPMFPPADFQPDGPVIWLDTHHRRIHRWLPNTHVTWQTEEPSVDHVNFINNIVTVNHHFEFSFQSAERLLGITIRVDFDAQEQINFPYGYRGY